MTYPEALGTLATSTEDKVWRVITEHENGTITRTEAVALIGALIAKANIKATALADLSLAANITTATGTPTPVLGLTTPDDVTRLNRAADTLLDALEDTPEPERRARRLGRSEPLKRASDARSEGIEQAPQVTGWIRQLNGDTCQLCTWWWRNGRVWPRDHPMPRHTGCNCSQQIVTVNRYIKPVQR